jgi:hypothetical protein
VFAGSRIFTPSTFGSAIQTEVVSASIGHPTSPSQLRFRDPGHPPTPPNRVRARPVLRGEEPAATLPLLAAVKRTDATGERSRTCLREKHTASAQRSPGLVDRSLDLETHRRCFPRLSSICVRTRLDQFLPRRLQLFGRHRRDDRRLIGFPGPGARKKKRALRPGVCVRWIDRQRCNHHRRMVGCMRPELGEFVQ